MENTDINMRELRVRNKVTLICYFFLCMVLFLSYLIELFKGNRTLGYCMVFFAILLIPFAVCAINYKRSPYTKATVWTFVVGWCVLYGFCDDDNGVGRCFYIHIIAYYSSYNVCGHCNVNDCEYICGSD